MPPPSSRIWLRPTNHSWAEALGNEHGRCQDFVSPVLVTIDRLVRPFDREEATTIPSHWGRGQLGYPRGHPAGPRGGVTSAAQPSKQLWSRLKRVIVTPIVT